MTALGPEFRYQDRVLKAREPRDGDNDGFVYDGTPRQRPATGNERYIQGLMRGAHKDNRRDNRESAPRPQRQRRTVRRTKPMTDRSPAVLNTQKQQYDYLGQLTKGEEVVLITREQVKRGNSLIWQYVMVNVEYRGHSGDDVFVRAWGSDRLKKVKYVRLLVPGTVVKSAVRRVGLDEWVEIDKAKAVDGDGDGWVYDATPKKRPATPAEMEAGRKLRQAAKKQPAKAAAKAGKKAAPKNDYDKRYDKFDRAINQAIRAGDPKEVKRVRDLIRQDLVLKANDRKDLEAILDARRDGKPDPVPVKGGNREKRGVKGGAAAVPAKKAPAKKAAAAKPPAKKAAAKKPAAPKESLKPDLPKGKFEMPGSMQIGQAYADKIKQAKTESEVLAVVREFNDNPRLRDVHRRALRQDAKKRRDEIKAKKAPSGEAARTPLSPAPQKGAGTAAYRNFDQEIDTQMPKAADKSRLDALFRRQIDADPDMDAAEKAALKYKLDRMKSARAKAQAPARPPASVPVQPRDTHGNKTKNWMRLVQRDIRNAKQAGDLDAAERQINSLERRGRITPAEAVALRAKVARARQKKFKPEGGGSVVERINRLRSAASRPVARRRARPVQDQAKVEADRLIAEINAASSPEALNRVKAGIGAPTQALMRNNRSHMARVNDAFKARAQAVRAGGQAQSERPSLVARRGAMQRFDGLEQMARDDPNRLESAIGVELNRIVADKDLSPSEKQMFIGKLENLWEDQQAEPSVLKPAPTIQPKRPPGAARARAKQQMGTQAEEYMKRVEGAQSAGDLDALVNEFNDQQDLSMTPEEVDAIFDEMERKMYRIAPIDDWRANIIDRPPRDITVPKYQGDPDQSPAGQHLAGGGQIEDVPDPDGMRDYIQAHPERFDLTIDDSGQASEVWFVRDKVNGKDYFFKTTNNNGDADMFGDGVNEYMAAALGNAAFADLFPQVDWAGRPEGGVNAAIRMDHIKEFAKRFTGVRGVSPNGHRAKGREIKDPRNPLAIHIFDYLINQTDRHGANFGVVNTDKGQVIIPLDNGGAFHGYDAYVAQPMGLQFFGIPERIGLALRDEPENVSYNDWAGLRKPQIMARLTQDAYREKNWGRSKLEQDAEQILEQFRKTDIDQIINDLRERFPNLNGYEDGHLEGARVIWKQRLANLSADDIVRMLG